MKILFISLTSILVSVADLSAQSFPTMTRIEPFQIEVTYSKTTHLIFPAPIRYVDLGSENLTAGKADKSENVLRVKASVFDFKGETNFTVITNDGRFYNFDVHYNALPTTLNYDLSNKQAAAGSTRPGPALFKELENDPPDLIDFLMRSVSRQEKTCIRRIMSRHYGIRFLIKGIYVYNGKFYIHTELSNHSNVPFRIDLINFKIVDQKRAKRTVVQERPLVPLRIFKPLNDVVKDKKAQNVFLLDQFTLSGDKELQIEILEKNGGRNQRIRLKNSDLIKAKPIGELQFKTDWKWYDPKVVVTFGYSSTDDLKAYL